jgi:hypothetical protein
LIREAFTDIQYRGRSQPGLGVVSPRVSEVSRRGSRSTTELEAVMTRVFALPYADQLEVSEELDKALGGGLVRSVSREQKLLRARVLEAIGQAVSYHGLGEDDRITSAQFVSASKALGLEVKLHVAIDAFELWRFAVNAYMGEHVPETSATRALRRATSGRKRSHDTYLSGVRMWLATSPASEQMSDHDAFVYEHNSFLAEGELPLVLAATIYIQLAVSWKTVKMLARGETSLDALDADHARRSASDDDWGDLVGLTVVARLLDTGCPRALVITRRGDFPTPAATINRRRVFHRAQVEAYRDRQPIPDAPELDLEARVMVNREVAALIRLSDGSIRRYLWLGRFDLVPEPAGRVSGAWWWLRDQVDEWLAAHERLIHARGESGHAALRDPGRRSRNA